MTQTLNEPLSAGLIAAAEDAAELAAPLAQCPALRLVAQAGMPSAARLGDAGWHDDPRAVLAQDGLAVLLLAGAPGQRAAYVKEAAARGLAIWTTPPLAPTLGAAVELRRACEAANALLHAASWWQVVQPSYADLMETHAGFAPRLSEIRVRTPAPPPKSWKRGRAAAGGGVLLNDACRAIETLVALRGLPERVSGTLAAGPHGGEPGWEAEGVATAVLHFSGATVGLLQAMWDVPPLEETARHYAPEATLELNAEAMRLLDPRGAELVHEDQNPAWLAADLSWFCAEVVRRPRGAGPAAALDRHMAVIALIEAIHLSARTGQVEYPAKFYEVIGWPEPHF